MMKKQITLLVTLLLVGCAARVSITECNDSNPPHVMREVRGSSRALEKKVADLYGQITGDSEHDKLIWSKLEFIQEVLWWRGYFVRQPFLLPNVTHTHNKAKELLDSLKNLSSDKRSDGACLAISPANPEMRRNSAVRITISDKRKNIKNWESYLKTIDKGLIIEQQIEPYQN